MHVWWYETTSMAYSRPKYIVYDTCTSEKDALNLIYLTLDYKVFNYFIDTCRKSVVLHTNTRNEDAEIRTETYEYFMTAIFGKYNIYNS